MSFFASDVESGSHCRSRSDRSCRHTPSVAVLQPGLFNQPQQSLVVSGTGWHRLLPPRIVPTWVNSQDPTHHPGCVLVFMLLDKLLLHPDSLAKYLAALFRISRSSVTRLRSTFSRRISSSRCLADCYCSAFSPKRLIQSYRLFVVTPSRSATSSTE